MSNSPDLFPIVIGGLRKNLHSGEHADSAEHALEDHTERILLPEDAQLSVLWAELTALGYDAPDWLQTEEEGKRITVDEDILRVHAFDEIEVVQERPSEQGMYINVDDALIAFTNRYYKNEVDLEIAESQSDISATPLQSLKYDSGLEITFHRTIRMPDDDKLHQLPGSLGAFPLYNVSTYAAQLPQDIVQQGGIFLPMWQREALWIGFSPSYKQKHALRVFVGRINAVSGLKMDERADQPIQDYVVVPGQEWLDGICVAPGIVRQFVAMPLGSGYTVEGQKTGQEKFGGLQIEIVPSYQTNLRTWQLAPTKQDRRVVPFDNSKSLDEQKTPSELGLEAGVKIRLYPSNPTYWAPYQIRDLIGTAPSKDTHVRARYQIIKSPNISMPSFDYSSRMCVTLESTVIAAERSYPIPSISRSGSGVVYASTSCYDAPHEPDAMRAGRGEDYGDERGAHIEIENISKVKVVTTDLKAMGLAAGGKLVQDIYRDSNAARTWNTEATRLVHVHILDPASCEKVTHIVPPPPPIDAMGYVEANMPFFVVEEQVDKRVDGGDFGNVASVSAMDKAKGVAAEPAFDPSKPNMCRECQTRLCDCVVRPCDHQFCNVCIKKIEGTRELASEQNANWKCPFCGSNVSHVAGFSAPMNLPGEEALKVKVPVHVLKIEDGRVRFKSIDRTRI